jgi:hypothetical protein
MKLALLLWLVALIVVSAFYAETAVLGFEGAPADRALVVKPHPGFGFEFGGGEEGSWVRDHPGQPKPWWLSGKQTVLLSGDYEEAGTTWWVEPYEWGVLVLPVIWIAWIIVAVVRRESVIPSFRNPPGLAAGAATKR